MPSNLHSACAHIFGDPMEEFPELPEFKHEEFKAKTQLCLQIYVMCAKLRRRSTKWSVLSSGCCVSESARPSFAACQLRLKCINHGPKSLGGGSTSADAPPRLRAKNAFGVQLGPVSDAYSPLGVVIRKRTSIFKLLASEN